MQALRAAPARTALPRTFSALLRCSICSTSLLLPASSSLALVGKPPVFCRLAICWICLSTSAFWVRSATSSSMSWRFRATRWSADGGGPATASPFMLRAAYAAGWRRGLLSSRGQR